LQRMVGVARSRHPERLGGFVPSIATRQPDIVQVPVAQIHQLIPGSRAPNPFGNVLPELPPEGRQLGGHGSLQF
jgi:hypothetical protein